MNSPKEAGLLATYIFKTSPISTFTAENLAITFPDNFFLIASELTIAIVLSTNSRLFSDLTYDVVQQVMANDFTIANTELKTYATFSVNENTVSMTNISSHLTTTDWTYVFIRGIKNPAMY